MLPISILQIIYICIYNILKKKVGSKWIIFRKVCLYYQAQFLLFIKFRYKFIDDWLIDLVVFSIPIFNIFQPYSSNFVYFKKFSDWIERKGSSYAEVRFISRKKQCIVCIEGWEGTFFDEGEMFKFRILHTNTYCNFAAIWFILHWTQNYLVSLSQYDINVRIVYFHIDS